MNFFLQKNKWKLIYFFILIVALLPILGDIVTKGATEYTLLVSRLIGFFCVIYAIHTMGRWGYSLAIFYFALKVVGSIMLILLYIKDLGLTVTFLNPKVLGDVICMIIIASISIPLLIIFIQELMGINVDSPHS